MGGILGTNLCLCERVDGTGHLKVCRSLQPDPAQKNDSVSGGDGRRGRGGGGGSIRIF